MKCNKCGHDDWTNVTVLTDSEPTYICLVCDNKQGESDVKDEYKGKEQEKPVKSNKRWFKNIFGRNN